MTLCQPLALGAVRIRVDGERSPELLDITADVMAKESQPSLPCDALRVEQIT